MWTAKEKIIFDGPLRLDISYSTFHSKVKQMFMCPGIKSPRV